MYNQLYDEGLINQSFSTEAILENPLVILYGEDNPMILHRLQAEFRKRLKKSTGKDWIKRILIVSAKHMKEGLFGG